jgi:hypothetical protein
MTRYIHVQSSPEKSRHINPRQKISRTLCDILRRGTSRTRWKAQASLKVVRG